MRLLLLAFTLLAVTSASAQTGTLAGQVLETDGVTSVIGANVRVEGTTLGSTTDIDGSFRIIGVPVGSYTVTASYAGYQSQSVTGTTVQERATRQLTFTLSVSDDLTICSFVYEAPLFTNDAIGQSRVLTGQDLENMPVTR